MIQIRYFEFDYYLEIIVLEEEEKDTKMIHLWMEKSIYLRIMELEGGYIPLNVVFR